MTIDELQIGGRNYLKDSHFWDTVNSWGRGTIDLLARLSEPIILNKTYSITSSSAKVKGIYAYYTDMTEGWLFGTKFVFSKPLRMLFLAYSGEDANAAVKQWIKIEKGNKPTDWTPALEDAFGVNLLKTTAWFDNTDFYVYDNIPVNAGDTYIFSGNCRFEAFWNSGVFMYDNPITIGQGVSSIRIYASKDVAIEDIRCKLEKGGIPTDWTPAIEDMAMMSDIPTSLPASDVYSWAKQPTKPSYSASEISDLPQNVLTTDRIFVQSTEPSNPKEGDIWFKR